MDKSQKLRIDEWVETAVYRLLQEAMQKGSITSTDAAAMTPLIQMYQAIQLENISSELDSLWHLFVDGDATITTKEL